jgi:hypothetical protein
MSATGISLGAKCTTSTETKKPTATMKATKIGTCQICGSAQKLPSGRLAKHGYTVEYGWGFNGVCNGSGKLPFEISKEYAEETLSCSKTRLENLVVPSEELEYGVSWRNINSPSLTEAQRTLKKQWNEYNQTSRYLSEFIRFQTPRCAAWTPKPLKDVAEETSKQETAKVATRNVRFLARLRDEAKRDLMRSVEKIEKAISCYDLSYPTTVNALKYADHARANGQAALADEVIAGLAAFKVAKAAHAAAAAHYEADIKAALAA